MATSTSLDIASCWTEIVQMTHFLIFNLYYTAVFRLSCTDLASWMQKSLVLEQGIWQGPGRCRKANIETLPDIIVHEKVKNGKF